MNDNRIIELYFARDDRAISETKSGYGRLIFSIAMGILADRPDSEECENDTYLRAWNSIPPTRPSYLSAYLSKITRNLAITRLRERNRRAALGTEMVFDELCECLPDTSGELSDDIALRDALNGFIGGLDGMKRRIFLKRYFYMRSVKEISLEVGMTQNAVKVVLFRLRNSLREYLESRGIVI